MKTTTKKRIVMMNPPKFLSLGLFKNYFQTF